MTKREIASLACKILAIYAFILSLSVVNGVLLTIAMASSSGGYGQPWFSGSTLLPALIGSVPAAIHFLCAFVLWRGGDWLAKHMVPDDSAVEEPNAGEVDWQKTGLSLIGVWMLANAAPQLLELGVRSYFDLNSLQVASTQIRSVDPLEFVGVVGRFVVGIWLFGGAPTILQMLAAPARWGRIEPREEVLGDE